jgi:uncharacterized spore protein YtfJ
MENNFEVLINQISAFMKEEAKTETVVGEAFRLGDYDCIPVIRVGMGFGTGGGEGEDEKHRHGTGMGAGGGMGIEPIGFLAARGDQISFISTKANNGLSSAFEKIPDLLNKYLETRKEVMS